MARANPKIQQFRKGEVEEAVIPELRNIMYEYARPFVMDDVLRRALAYLATLDNRGVQSIWVTIEFSYMLSHMDSVRVSYDGTDCGICGGKKGCFSVLKLGELISKTCSVSETVREIYRYQHRRRGMEIESIILVDDSDESINSLFRMNSDGTEFNALNAGYSMTETGNDDDGPVPLPGDF